MAESTEWLYDAIIRFLQVRPSWAGGLVAMAGGGARADRGARARIGEARAGRAPRAFDLTRKPTRTHAPTQGPLYSGPLMSFIDANCEVFDGEEENKLEYTEVHGKFKALVDDLITGFIAELGVEDKVFMEAVTSQGSNKLNSFVLTSILTVDDFVQFKAMMVKRNTDLTAEVLEMHAKAKGESAADNAAAASSEADAGAEDAELTEALRLSREQFELEKTRTQVRVCAKNALQTAHGTSCRSRAHPTPLHTCERSTTLPRRPRKRRSAALWPRASRRPHRSTASAPSSSRPSR